MTGATTGAAAMPDAPVTTYMRQNPVDPAYPEGEVVTGASLPDTVALRPMPDPT